LLIENGASVETITNNGSNLLHVAAEFCRDQIITYLIQEHKRSVDSLDSLGLTPFAETTINDGSNLLHVAAQYCRDQIITYLIQEHKISVDSPDSSGQTPLFCALFANKSIPEDNVLATVKLLIKNGASAETTINNGSNLLHRAALYCRDQIISYLIQEHKRSVDSLDSLGLTPLFHALLANKSIPENNVLATVQLLIENGASVDTTINNGSNLLHIAAKYCRDQIITYLIQEHKISVDTPDSSGLTPLFYALSANKSIPEDDVMATVKLLIKNGASAETTINDGSNLLHVAAKYCRDQIITYLIQEHKISVDLLDSSGLTPLFHALLANKSTPEDNVLATVQLLIKNGASAETTINGGSNLLHVAAQYCRDQIITYLIQEHKISVDTPDSSGITPLFYALLANKSIPEDNVLATVKL
ncbi:Ankyrin 2, partial [Carabus blaptoides fortunei]